MRAISLWQPWASLWCSGRKVHETRHWPTSHRGLLAVHAAKKFEKDFAGHPLDEILTDEFGGHWAIDLPTGALVGIVNLVACKPTDSMVFNANEEWDDYQCGDFSPGRYAWEANSFKTYVNPIPYRGAQGLFNVPDDILPRLAA